MEKCRLSGGCVLDVILLILLNVAIQKLLTRGLHMTAVSGFKSRGFAKLTVVIVTVMLLAVSFNLAGCGAFGDVSVKKALQLKNQGAIVLDIRPSLVYDQGHIEGSKNMDYGHVNFSGQINELDKDTIYLICGSSFDAAAVVLLMQENGFKEVHAIQNGIDGWKEAGYPISIW